MRFIPTKETLKKWGRVPLMLPLFSFFYAVLSGFLPLASTELYLVSIAFFTKGLKNILLVALFMTAGQMLTKIVIFHESHRFSDVKKVQNFTDKFQKIETLQKKYGDSKWRVGTFVFVSALTGIPPLLLITMGAGFLSLRFDVFIGASCVGLFIRYIILMQFPHLVRQWLTFSFIKRLRYGKSELPRI